MNRIIVNCFLLDDVPEMDHAMDATRSCRLELIRRTEFSDVLEQRQDYWLAGGSKQFDLCCPARRI